MGVPGVRRRNTEALKRLRSLRGLRVGRVAFAQMWCKYTGTLIPVKNNRL